MKISRVAIVFLCVLPLGIMGCGASGNGETERKAQVLNAARNWTEIQTETVTANIVTVVTSAVPGSPLFRGAIARQIAGRLNYAYSEPVKMSDGAYEITATVSAQATINPPLLGEKTYRASLPINLRVDLATASVISWSADFDRASVGEIEAAP